MTLLDARHLIHHVKQGEADPHSSTYIAPPGENARYAPLPGVTGNARAPLAAFNAGVTHHFSGSEGRGWSTHQLYPDTDSQLGSYTSDLWSLSITKTRIWTKHHVHGFACSHATHNWPPPVAVAGHH